MQSLLVSDQPGWNRMSDRNCRITLDAVGFTGRTGSIRKLTETNGTAKSIRETAHQVDGDSSRCAAVVECKAEGHAVGTMTRFATGAN